MTEIDVDKMVVEISLKLLKGYELPTTDTIRDAVHSVMEMLDKRYSLDKNKEDKFVRELETLCNIYVPTISSLDDMSDHIEWLSSRRAEIAWRFWKRYQMYLEDKLIMPPQAVRSIDDVTDQILSRLENPLRKGSWDRRGMVVGQVQSGKTSNYTALICKAADAGYKFIVVLAGVHNSLRSQTQLRLDEGFIGFDTQQRSLYDPTNIRSGVGHLPTELYIVHSLTNSANKGDFNLAVARQAMVRIGGADPVVLVVKKNVSVLRNLLKWSTNLSTIKNNSKNQVDVPLIVIDDEADNASINTNNTFDDDHKPDPDLDPSSINGLIRQLLNSFIKSAYVGYTATPFANIFIADTATNEKFGDDLFPRSFIINLHAPSNYFGPAKLFGLATDPQLKEDAPSSLPLVRPIDDHLGWVPDGHKKEHKPGPLPQSIKDSLNAFVLTCAIRHVRGQEHNHNSMLIHVTRFTAVQSYIYDQVKDELAFLVQRLRYGDENTSNSALNELYSLWRTDYRPTTAKFADIEPDLVPVTWEQIKNVLTAATSKIEIRKINGTAKDTLQYVEHKDGLSVICIGGDKLSRGLTLEGLSVSYYLRASKMYDTLMQMGRWFGYRTGYTDLCRLYTTSELINDYRYITAADEELRQRFEDMAAQERTPKDYGLGIKKHPGELIITAATKMRGGQTISFSYAQDIVETVVFSKDITIKRQNFQATEQLIQSMQAQHPYQTDKNDKSNYIWRGISGDTIVEFLRDYSTHETAITVQSPFIREYIQKRIKDKELTEWTVALISNTSSEKTGDTYSIMDLNIGLTLRTSPMENNNSNIPYSIGRLLNPLDELLDFSEDEKHQADEATKQRRESNPGKYKSTKPPTVPSGVEIRKIRPTTRGLLILYALKPQPEVSSSLDRPIIGFAISFPGSKDKSGNEYVVNSIWKQQMGEMDDL